MNSKRFASCGALAIALVSGGSTAAWAQETSSTEGQAVSAVAVGPQGETSSADIVVTAQKRAERLEKIPISITSIGADQLQSAGVSSTGQLQQVVPALRIDYSGSFAQPTIRGVGSALSGAGLSSNVSTYVDGFYQPSMFTTDFDLVSVNNVSVLKGPQGTLFGRNATGGAIVVTTDNPSYTPKLIASASYARFNNAKFGFYGSTGLTDSIAVNLAGSYERGDGFVRNIITGKDAAPFERYTIRGKLLLEPTDTLSLTLGYQHAYNNDPMSYAWSAMPGTAVAAQFFGATVATKPFEHSETQQQPLFKSRVNAVTLKGELDLGFADLVSYSMYRHQKAYSGFTLDASTAPIFDVQFDYVTKTITQEVNLVSKPGTRFTYVLGLFYFNDDDGGPFRLAAFGAPYTPGYLSVQKSEAVSAFADATYEVADKLFVTAGLRYDIETRRAHYEVYNLIVAPIGSDTAKATFRAATPRLNVRYELNDRTSAYASWSRGFKSGVFNPTGQDLSYFVPPEKIDAFEIGFKTATADGIRFDASIYYYDYRNLQVASFRNTSAIVQSAGKAEIYGADIQTTVPLTTRLTITAAGAYTHARYKDFDNAPRYGQCLVVACGPAFGLFTVTPVSADGNRVQRAPTLTGNISVDYKFELAGGSKVALNASGYYTSRVYFDPVEQFTQAPYGLLNARATWTSADDHLSFSIFGNNLTDKQYRNQVLPGQFAILQTYGTPATYGASVKFKY